MLIEIVKPRFCETNAAGHIDNISIMIWFEHGRAQLFLQHMDNMTLSDIVVANINVNFLSEAFFGPDAAIHTGISKVGNSSVHINQYIYQGDTKIAEATTVLVRIDAAAKSAIPFSDQEKTIFATLIDSQ